MKSEAVNDSKSLADTGKRFGIVAAMLRKACAAGGEDSAKLSWTATGKMVADALTKWMSPTLLLASASSERVPVKQLAVAICLSKIRGVKADDGGAEFYFVISLALSVVVKLLLVAPCCVAMRTQSSLRVEVLEKRLLPESVEAEPLAASRDAKDVIAAREPESQPGTPSKVPEKDIMSSQARGRTTSEVEVPTSSEPDTFESVISV